MKTLLGEVFYFYRNFLGGALISARNRAGTIRRLSPTIVAKCSRFNESIPNHKKSILVTTVNMGKMPYYGHKVNSNTEACQLSVVLSIHWTLSIAILSLFELPLTLPYPKLANCNWTEVQSETTGRVFIVHQRKDWEILLLVSEYMHLVCPVPKLFTYTFLKYLLPCTV